MTAQKFVELLRTAVVDENAVIYRDLFSKTPIEKASDPYWRRALTLFGALPQDQKEVFFEVIRQTVVDTTSNILGVIDGVNGVDGLSGGFELRFNGEEIGGDLQSKLLVSEELDRKIKGVVVD